MAGNQPMSWWQTVPGILTGIAGIITATAGLIVVLSQVGVLSEQDNAPERDESSVSSSIQEDVEETDTISPVENTSKGDDLSTSLEVQAVINDPDGYTNVQSDPGTQYSTVARIVEGEIFYAIPQQNDWWPVRTKDNELGYMHRSRIKVQD